MKDKNVAAILAFCLGGVGAHHFYLGQTGRGLLYLMFCWTLIPAFAAFVDFISLALMDDQEFHARYNGTRALPGPHQVVLQMLPPGGRGHGGWQPRSPSHTVEELKADLEKLQELRISGLLDEDEFVEQKRRLLERM